MSDKKAKLSPWNDGEVKPIHVGVYQRLPMSYSFWNGKRWNFSMLTIEDARHEVAKSFHQSIPWRGILK